MPRQKARSANESVISMENDLDGFQPTQLPAASVSGGLPATQIEQHYPDDPGAETYMSEEDELSAVLSSLGDAGEEGSVSIFRYAPGTKKKEWVDRRTTSEFNNLGLPWMAKMFGAGEFEIYIYGPDKLIKARRRILISEAAARLHKEPEPPQNGSAEQLVQTMVAGFQELGKLIVAQSQRPADDAEEKVLQKMLKYKQLFGGDHAPVPQQNPLNQMRAAIDFVRELQPRPEGQEAGFADAAIKFMEKFGGPILERIQQAPPQQQVVALPAGQIAQPVAAAPSMVTQQPQGDNAVLFQNAMLKSYMGMLIDSAAQDADPYTYANLILDKVPEAMVRSWLGKPDLVAELAKIDPRVAQHAQWFVGLKTEIERILAEETNPEQS